MRYVFLYDQKLFEGDDVCSLPVLLVLLAVKACTAGFVSV